MKELLQEKNELQHKCSSLEEENMGLRKTIKLKETENYKYYTIKEVYYYRDKTPEACTVESMRESDATSLP